MDGTIGVLLMAYGSPESLAEVKAYYTHIRGGTEPSAAEVDRLVARYARIGGKSPLHTITFEEARLLEERLNSAGKGNFKVYVGMKHCKPFIEDAVREMAGDMVGKAVALVLAPHYAKMSVGEYFRRVEEENKRQGSTIAVSFVKDWHTNSHFIEAVSRNVAYAMEGFGADAGKPFVIFSAHSLPARIIGEGDPYESQLKESCGIVADRLGIGDWALAYQSIPARADNWLGPEIKQAIRSAGEKGYRDVVVCPIGFVSDHLEILHDIDIECQSVAAENGIRLKRTESLNTDPLLIEALADSVWSAIQG